MKNLPIKTTLLALALGSLGMLSTAAQAADNNRFGYGHGHGTRANSVAYSPSSHRGQPNHLQNKQFIQRINARQHRQMNRIQAGKQSGSLTRHEFRELKHEQRHIRAMKRDFLADGFMSPREFHQMDRALDRANRNIRAEKRDYQARNNRGHNVWSN
ncbi:MAG TPA: hypothetical protein VIN38_02900 [Thiobacillus sp.]